MTQRKIKSWAIVVNYSDNDDDMEYITEMPDSVSGPIDDYLTETREDNNDTKG
jgi:hypothetical protein